MVKCFRSHAKCQPIALKYVLLFFFHCQCVWTFCWETTLRSGLHFVLCAITFIRKQLIERHSSIMIGTNLWRVLEFACRCESVWGVFLGTPNGATCRSCWCQIRQHAMLVADQCADLRWKCKFTARRIILSINLDAMHQTEQVASGDPKIRNIKPDLK